MSGVSSKGNPKPDNLLSDHGEVYLFPGFLTAAEADDMLQRLLIENGWEQAPVTVFGKKVLQPRLTKAYADAGIVYGYSGARLSHLPWSMAMRSLKKKVESAVNSKFNAALLNLYRDGRDSMGWHRDNEAALGRNPIIASVSLGAERKFLLRMYRDKSKKVSLLLPHGSLLLMAGETQDYWEHALPKTKLVSTARINITFRKVVHRNI